MPPSVLMPLPPLPTAPPLRAAPSTLQTIVESPNTISPTQLSQPPVPISLSPLSQETLPQDHNLHRYPTRFSLSQPSYALACTKKYSYAAQNLPTSPTPSVHFSAHMACPVIDPDYGANLEYRHLIEGPDKDI